MNPKFRKIMLEICECLLIVVERFVAQNVEQAELDFLREQTRTNIDIMLDEQ